VPDHITQTATEPLAVDTQKAASLLDSSGASLEKDRAIGHMGVPYVKAGHRVFYRLSDLDAWSPPRPKMGGQHDPTSST